MIIAIETKAGVIFTRDYPNKTYKEVARIEREFMRKAGWTETRKITGISQFRILKEDICS